MANPNKKTGRTADKNGLTVDKLIPFINSDCIDKGIIYNKF